MSLLVPVLALAFGQFVGGNDLPKRRHDAPVTGIEILQWREVAEDLGLTEAAAYRSLHTPPKPAKPSLQPMDGFVDDLIDLPKPNSHLTQKQSARLRQIYIQYLGSTAVLRPEIAKAVGFTSAQSKALQARMEREWPKSNPFRKSFDWGTYDLKPPPGGKGMDASITRSLWILDLFRTMSLQKHIRCVRERELCRQALTQAQIKRLKDLEGKPIGAALHYTDTSLGNAAGPTSGSDFRRGLQEDGIFSVLRHDISRKLGLSEAQVDGITLDLENLYLRAYREADEFWWLLKRDGSERQITNHREAVFKRSEAEARHLIRQALTRIQQARWDALVGPPILWVGSRNHIGWLNPVWLSLNR